VITPPSTEAELLARARALAGLTLPELAARLGHRLPADLRRHKGVIGALLEAGLGASAGSKAEPDFPGLGVELKTIPVGPTGRPRESTFVCTANLDVALSGAWPDSWVRRKLSRVLWVPVVHQPEPVIGAAVLWSPSDEEDAALAADWHDLADSLARGELWRLHARHGHVLQLRPKGADNRDLTWIAGEDEERVQDMRRGFYLRPAFTGAVLGRLLQLPPAAR
jgi:DNA mismatch repair protein MutH